jgi:hypothetical protein
MIGKLLEKTIRVATLPIDAVERSMNVIIGEDGSRETQKRMQRDGLNPLSAVRDAIAEAARDIDSK